MSSLILSAADTALPARWRDHVARGLMLLFALGALTAFASALPAVQAAGADTVWLETWRLFGFAVFAGLFALLAWRPRALPGIWELVFLHKAAMATAALFLAGAREAADRRPGRRSARARHRDRLPLQQGLAGVARALRLKPRCRTGHGPSHERTQQPTARRMHP